MNSPRSSPELIVRKKKCSRTQKAYLRQRGISESDLKEFATEYAYSPLSFDAFCVAHLGPNGTFVPGTDAVSSPAAVDLAAPRVNPMSDFSELAEGEIELLFKELSDQLLITNHTKLDFEGLPADDLRIIHDMTRKISNMTVQLVGPRIAAPVTCSVVSVLVASRKRRLTEMPKCPDGFILFGTLPPVRLSVPEEKTSDETIEELAARLNKVYEQPSTAMALPAVEWKLSPVWSSDDEELAMLRLQLNDIPRKITKTVNWEVVNEVPVQGYWDTPCHFDIVVEHEGAKNYLQSAWQGYFGYPIPISFPTRTK